MECNDNSTETARLSAGTHGLPRLRRGVATRLGVQDRLPSYEIGGQLRGPGTICLDPRAHDQVPSADLTQYAPPQQLAEAPA
jgi:hypothetical protein